MTKKVAVIGLGYVGLPMAALCAIKGYSVVGLDNKEEVVASLAQGCSHIRDNTVERLLREAHETGSFSPTTDSGTLADCSIYLICVPTPVTDNQEPDLTPLEHALETVAEHLKPGDTVVVESTVFPGTCEEVALPLLEAGSELRAGKDFTLAHCPERVNPGDAFWTSENIPRVIGATSTQGAKTAAEFYASLLGGKVYDVRDVRDSLRPKFFLSDDKKLQTAHIPPGSITIMHSIRDAEAVKAMENTVRDVNIAFVNELAKISDVLDLDVVDIIDGMSTKPFGKGPFYPGVGVGGHCIAVDPEWLKAASKRAGYMPEMIQLSRITNNGMPGYTVSILQDSLNERGLPIKGTNIAILGVAYKKNVDDLRESPFYEVYRLLKSKGAVITVFDPWVDTENTVDSLEDAIEGAQAILIVTDHDDMIEKLKQINFTRSQLQVLIDGRNSLTAESIENQGVLYRGIGRRSH